MTDKTVYIAVTPAMRRVLASMAENLVDMLDQIDGDENLEEPGDLEPSIGWPEGGPSRLAKEMRHDDDREADLGGTAGYDVHGRLQYELEADTSDDEPWLGSPEQNPWPGFGTYSPPCSQEHWGKGVSNDAEENGDEGDFSGNEDDGGIPGYRDPDARPAAQEALQRARQLKAKSGARQRDPDELVMVASGGAQVDFWFGR